MLATIPLYDVEVPPLARVWGLRAGLTPELLSDRFGFRYHKTLGRVIIPTGSAGAFTRHIHSWDNMPKYLHVGDPAQRTVNLIRPDNTPVVVVEDALSAIKIYSAGYSAVALMSTAITPQAAADIAAPLRPVVIWLDPDYAGRKAVGGVRKALRLYPVQVNNIQTDTTVDPKYLSFGAIKSEVEKVMNNGG